MLSGMTNFQYLLIQITTNLDDQGSDSKKTFFSS